MLIQLAVLRETDKVEKEKYGCKAWGAGCSNAGFSFDGPDAAYTGFGFWREVVNRV
jgi:hypothetical protein